MTRFHLAALSLLTLTLALPLVGVSAAQAAEPPPTDVSRGFERAPAPRLPAVGVMADVGLPDGAGASLVYRPRKWVRLHGGGTYNMISSGVRAGASFTPLGWGPSLTVEGGHYFDGDANGLVRKFAGASYQSNAVLERIGYDYANAHLGLELGFRRATFYIHGGMSFIRATVHNIDQAIQSETSSDGSSSTQLSVKQDPTIRAFTPSAKLGLIVYLW
jgi:hypothetical protein